MQEEERSFSAEEKKNISRQKKEKKHSNVPIWIVLYIFVILMLVCVIHEFYFMRYESETVINNSYNPRQTILASRNIRGSILSADGEALAQTVKSKEDGSEKRIYPYANLFSHVVGFSTKGKTGVENIGNMQLLNSHSSLGSKISNELSSEKNIGDNVVTTLNVAVQKEAYLALGAYDGAIIVTEPDTGKIIAMVSKPDFDPNEIVDIWDDLVDNTESSVLLNRATQGLYPPGSTFKIVTSLAYYRQNAGDVSRYSFNCGGSFTYEGNRINCYHGSSHGSEDFKKSFAKSCNSSFANIGVSLDLAGLNSTCEDLLFNQDFKLDYTVANGKYVLGTNADSYDVMQTSIGQGKTQITPMQLNMITCAVANKGNCMKPMVVDHVESYEGNLVKQYNPETYAELMTEDEAVFLTDLMTEVVKTGTATRLQNDNYTAAGKTGSAEYNGNKADSHAWFTGFAPAEDPQVCVTIIVEGAGSGGEYAVPIAKRIFDAYFASVD